MCRVYTWAREIRSLLKWPEVSPLMASSSDFLYSEKEKEINETNKQANRN